MRPILRILSLAFGLLPAAALADEATIRKVLEPMLGARIEGVRRAPVAGLYEVHFQTEEGARILYTDANAAYVIQGEIYELRSGRRLTEERLRKLSAIDFASLPLDQAVKIRRGNGKRILAMFSDPYCPACKQFEAALQQVDDITIYVFMYPVIRPDLSDHSRAVWCSADRGKAWLDLVLRGKVPSLRVNATPTLILGNGERHAGGMPLAELTQRLDMPR
jgi:thiol:disulfide interchange protein DsbC